MSLLDYQNELDIVIKLGLPWLWGMPIWTEWADSIHVVSDKRKTGSKQKKNWDKNLTLLDVTFQSRRSLIFQN